ncbi:MAG TPA: type II secretion system protein [bacterium]|nr:type II secretion system protein [bacterium]
MRRRTSLPHATPTPFGGGASGRGFTLVEMLTVAALIAILSTVALASMRRSRGIAIETAAIGGLKTLATAEYQYFARAKSFGTFQDIQRERDLVDRRYSPADDMSTTLDTPIAPFYSLRFTLRDDTYVISAIPVPNPGYDLRTFVVSSDGDIGAIFNGPSGTSIVPIFGAGGS